MNVFKPPEIAMKRTQALKEELSQPTEKSQREDDLRIMSRMALPKIMTEHRRPPRKMDSKLCSCLPRGPQATSKFCRWISADGCTLQRLEFFMIECFVVLLVWAILWSFLKEDALPGSCIFAVAVLTVLSYLVSGIIKAYTNFLPGHYMVALGILARYTVLPELKKMGNYLPYVMDYTKRMAFVVFLLRAGLGTNLIHVKRYSSTSLRLIFIPLAVESLYVCVASKYALDIPWEWSALIGLTIAPTSPINVFTTMFRLREQGYSPHHEIHSVIIFSCIIDNLIAICFCTSVISRTCIKRGWWESPLILIPGQILIGTVFGILVGFVGIYVPSNNNIHSDVYRGLYFVSSSSFFIFMLSEHDLRGASYLAAYISPLVATTGWKHLNYYDCVVRMRNFSELLWSWTQPFLFTLIGTDINVNFLIETKRLKFVGVYFSSMLVNFSSAILASLYSSFPWTHRLLLSLSVIPKGSIEIAVCGWIVTAVKENFPSDKEKLDRAQLVVDCSVLALLTSGPFGGIIMDIVGRTVLRREKDFEGYGLDETEKTDGKVSLPSGEGKTGEVKRSEQIV